MEVEAQPNMIYNFLNEAKGRHKAHIQFFCVCVCAMARWEQASLRHLTCHKCHSYQTKSKKDHG